MRAAIDLIAALKDVESATERKVSQHNIVEN